MAAVVLFLLLAGTVALIGGTFLILRALQEGRQRRHSTASFSRRAVARGMLRATFHPRHLGSIADHDLRAIVKRRVEVEQGVALIVGGVFFMIVALSR